MVPIKTRGNGLQADRVDVLSVLGVSVNLRQYLMRRVGSPEREYRSA